MNEWMNEVALWSPYPPATKYETSSALIYYKVAQKAKTLLIARIFKKLRLICMIDFGADRVTK